MSTITVPYVPVATQISAYTGDVVSVSSIPIVEGQTTIQTSNNLCFGVVNNNGANGAVVQQETCTGNPNQQWIFDNDTGAIKTSLSGERCIMSNNGEIQLSDCTGKSSQYFDMMSNSSIVNPISYSCLDSTTGLVGDAIQIVKCSGSATQQFSLGNPPTTTVFRSIKKSSTNWNTIIIVILSIVVLILIILIIYILMRKNRLDPPRFRETYMYLPAED